jgi:starch synthase (maltosyl-transferring)
VAAAESLGIEIALDIAFQCSPDHPYVTQHPEWFRQRPDGTIQYAENPPKKYQDIYPFDFESPDWTGLWDELKSIFDFWIELGVKIFRVDNPHTKPFAFWEWCIGEIKQAHPDVLFLAEAFTRPKIMGRLAKLGFTQSYTYFAWRNTKRELTEYVTALTRSELREFLRPNFWPNTPDILPEYLQLGGRAAFMSRLVLAALLSPNYGIYGPPFEHGWQVPREPGSEEYLDSEKYQVHHHDWTAPTASKTSSPASIDCGASRRHCRRTRTCGFTTWTTTRSSASARRPRIARKSCWPSSVWTRTIGSRAGWNCRWRISAWTWIVPVRFMTC